MTCSPRQKAGACTTCRALGGCLLPDAQEVHHDYEYVCKHLCNLARIKHRPFLASLLAINVPSPAKDTLCPAVCDHQALGLSSWVLTSMEFYSFVSGSLHLVDALCPSYVTHGCWLFPMSADTFGITHILLLGYFWVVFSLGLLWMKLLQTFECTSLSKRSFPTG